jgi:Spy/CpxP family protein refolding chaperone
MSRVKIIIMFAFVLAMFAGVAVGMLGARMPASREPRSWLADELNLSSDQRDQMRAVWQDVSKNRQTDWERRRALDKERTEAVLALLSDEQKARYDKINQDFTVKMQEMSKQREQAFADAQERTKAILTEEQRVKYEQLMQKRREEKGNRGDRRHGGSSGPSTDPSARVSMSR